MRIEYSSPDLASLEKTLKRRFGKKAMREFMARSANRAVDDCEKATVIHLANRLRIPPSLVRSHIYFRRKSDGKSLAVVAWSPSRRVPLKTLRPIQTAIGVRWRWAGRSRSRRHAFLYRGHVFRRKKEGRALVPRFPIEKLKGPRIEWDDAWDANLREIIASRFFSDAEAWMNERVR